VSARGCSRPGRARETANRVKCASNLRQIGQAILLYSNENRGAYPRTYTTIPAGNGAVVPTWGTGATPSNGLADPFKSDSQCANNDVSAALFLLLRTQDITSEVFTCPVPIGIKDSEGRMDRHQLGNRMLSLGLVPKRIGG
jgi:hypothetical protein